MSVQINKVKHDQFGAVTAEVEVKGSYTESRVLIEVEEGFSYRKGGGAYIDLLVEVQQEGGPDSLQIKKRIWTERDKRMVIESQDD